MISGTLIRLRLMETGEHAITMNNILIFRKTSISQAQRLQKVGYIVRVFKGFHKVNVENVA